MMSKTTRAFAFIIALVLFGAGVPTTHAVTSKPTPKPTVKASTKAPVKPSVKTGSKVTTPKKKVAKKVYRKYKPRKRVVITPSPAPNWPPAGFVSNNGVYAKVPTGAELVGILSALKSPSGSVKQCSQDPLNPTVVAKSCGAVLAAAQDGCSWWEVNSQVNGVDPNNPNGQIMLGNLRTLSGGTPAHSVSTIVVVSDVPLTTGVKFTNITVKCWPTPTTEHVPSNTFTPSTPTPTPSRS
jgi:hypothetical protein